MCELILVLIIALVVIITALSLLFDQARITRHGTLFKIPAVKDKAALSFDDGPDPVWTQAVLDELKKYEIKATFFLIGKKAALYPDLVRTIAQEGHEIGNHGYSHSFFSWLNFRRELLTADALITDLSGKKPNLFRPARGWIFGHQKQEAENLGYKTVLWSINSKDWSGISADTIVKRITQKLSAGDIILCHDSGSVFGISGGNRAETVKAISKLKAAADSRNLKLVPVGELLAQ